MENLKEQLKQLFLSGELQIETSIVAVQAKAGSGQWNECKTYVYLDGEVIANYSGDVDIIEAR